MDHILKRFDSVMRNAFLEFLNLHCHENELAHNFDDRTLSDVMLVYEGDRDYIIVEFADGLYLIIPDVYAKFEDNISSA